MTDIQDVRLELARRNMIPKQDLMERIKLLSTFQGEHECSRCGRCCIHSDPIGILGSEQALIAKQLSMSIPEFRDKYIHGRMGQWLLIRKEEDHPCPFLEGTPGQYRCRIYPVRPGVCIAFPWLSHITIELTKPPMVGISEGMCPNMNDTFARVKRMGL